MTTVKVRAETGRQKGSRPSGRLRRSGQIPAVVYGMGITPFSVSVSYIELRNALSGEAGMNVLLALDVDEVEHLAIVKDVQRHPVRNEVLHVDFLRIDPTKEVEVEVPLVIVGETKKVTQMSGMVDQVLHRAMISAKVDKLPVEIVADVSSLEVGTSLRLADIQLPEGVSLASDPEAPFAVGLITRSTKEYLRQLKAAQNEMDTSENV